MAKKTSTNKPKTIAELQAELKKKNGINILGTARDIMNEEVEVISSGSLSLDIALQRGGFPRGRLIELWGPEYCGKTTIALQTAANAQKMGLNAAYIDAESGLDMEYMENLGINLDDLLVMGEPGSAENVLDTVDRLCGVENMGLIVVDSIPALLPESVMSGEIGDQHYAPLPRLLGSSLPKILQSAKRGNTAVIFINQMRDKVGVKYGSPKHAPGGNALKHYMSVRVELKKPRTNKDNSGESDSNTVHGEILKTRVGRPKIKFETNMYYGIGVDKDKEIFDLAVQYDIVERNGAWYRYEGDNLGQGRDSAFQVALDNNLLPTFKEKILEVALPKKDELDTPTEDDVVEDL